MEGERGVRAIDWSLVDKSCIFNESLAFFRTRLSCFKTNSFTRVRQQYTMLFLEPKILFLHT